MKDRREKERSENDGKKAGACACEDFENLGGEKIDEALLLKYLAKIEDLAEKKSKIYSRLLIDPRLAQDMESLAVGHAQGKKSLLDLAKKEEAGGNA